MMPTPGDPSRPSAPAPALTARDTLVLAVWLGLAAGLLEALLFSVASHKVDARAVAFDPHVFWMTPVGAGLWFGVGGLVSIPAARLLPRFVTPRTVTFGLILTGLASALFLFAPQVDRIAAVLLAGGIAFQASRALDRRFDAFLAFARRTLPGAAAGTALIACTIFGWRSLRERQVLQALTPPPPDAPNVLLIVLDTVRAQDLSLHSYARETTPNLALLARTGVAFERAVTPAPWTLATHGGIFTGRSYRELGVDWTTPLDGTHRTLAEIVSDRGYATAGFVGNRRFCGRWTGLDRGFAHYDDFCVTPGRILEAPALFRYVLRHVRQGVFDDFSDAGRTAAPDVSGAFLGWLSSPPERPFFAFLNYFDAHDPYCPPPPYDTRFGIAPPPSAYLNCHEAGVYGDREIEAYRAQYDGAIAYLDHELGRLFDALRARGVLENTLVIVTSDHGEEFAEHGVVQHGASLYMPALHVPLVVSMPSRVPAGRRVTEAVPVRDLGATILDLAGLADGAVRFPGSSLARHWTGASQPAAEPILSEQPKIPWCPEWWPTGAASLSSVVSGGFHYIRSDSGSERLYDWYRDPWETQDLSASPEHRATLSRCRDELTKLLVR